MLLVGVFLGVLTLLICDHVVGAAGEDRIYRDIAAVPYHCVGLVLGTSRH